MKLAIIVFLVSFLLGGGGFTAYMMLVQGKSFADIKAMVSHAPPEKPPEPEVKVEPPGVFYEMRPIMVTALINGKPSRHLTMKFVVEFSNQEAATMFEPKMHRLHHAFLEYLHTIAQYEQFDDVRDAPLLRAKLQAIADEMFGKGIIRSILLQGEQRTIIENKPQ